MPGPDASITLALSALPFTTGDARVTHYRIDDTHSNAYAEWKRLGSPIAPNRQQYAPLETAGRLSRLDAPPTVRVARRATERTLALPRQTVSLLLIEW